jgi:hypothetical protein
MEIGRTANPKEVNVYPQEVANKYVPTSSQALRINRNPVFWGWVFWFIVGVVQYREKRIV